MDSGRPSSSIRFRARAAIATSVTPTAVHARPQRVPDHPLVAGDRSLRQSTTVVAGALLPAQAALLGDGPEVPIARWEGSVSAAALGTAPLRGGTTTAASGCRSATVPYTYPRS